ncbi:hypothetical protein BD413DRAFT_112767 [Trametes elegans]|nr:hypothetical protein BD413DRAFT_112767 [Trametes elegans]
MPVSTCSTDTQKAAGRMLRPFTASQIAKDTAAFETWATHQRREEVDLNNLPLTQGKHTAEVFNFFGRLPEEWADKHSKVHRRLKRTMGAGFMNFLLSAHAAAPEIFSPDVVDDEESRNILRDLQVVSRAWDFMNTMHDSTRKWSEADYAEVYALVRRPAIWTSDHRAQCSIALPQPFSVSKIYKDSTARILGAKSAKPDGALFVPTHHLQTLSLDENSAYKVLCRHRPQGDSGHAVGGEFSFRYQSTVCVKIPDAQVPEVASAFWEDKKPGQDKLDPALRQNGIATTAALRHLHALNVKAPVFGIVWSENTVRAHVDWWKIRDKRVVIQSAPFKGTASAGTRRNSALYNDWDLRKAEDIIQVYLLVRNLDQWTTGMFRDAVLKGVNGLMRKVQKKGRELIVWRRHGLLKKTVDEPQPPEAVEAPAPAAKKRRSKRRKSRSSVGSNV